MEKKNNILIILIVILSILVGVLGSFIIFDKVLIKDTNEENKQKENNSVVEETNYYGTYTVKYNENADEVIKNNLESSLTLNEDNTFVFYWNLCAGMANITGNYNIVENKIVLTNLTATAQDVLNENLNGRTNLEFIIVSEDEIYLNLEQDFACTIAGNKNGSFIKK